MIIQSLASAPALPASLSESLLRCNNVAEMKALAPLPLHAQELIDRAVIGVGLDRLAIIGDAIAKGLVTNIPDPLGITEIYWERESRIG